MELGVCTRELVQTSESQPLNLPATYKASSAIGLHCSAQEKLIPRPTLSPLKRCTERRTENSSSGKDCHRQIVKHEKYKLPASSIDVADIKFNSFQKIMNYYLNKQFKLER